MFLKLLEVGLAYRKESWVNWDPVENTVLANEQVVDGCGWRSGAPVERRLLSQWFLKITEFADDLLAAIEGLNRWPDRVRLMQSNWIGKSEGARVRFQLTQPLDEKIVLKYSPLGQIRYLVHLLLLSPQLIHLLKLLVKLTQQLQNLLPSVPS